MSGAFRTAVHQDLTQLLPRNCAKHFHQGLN